MADGNLPDIETLRKLLAYDPETGALTWRKRPVEMFSDGSYPAERAASAWNASHAGRPAFTASEGNGYRCGRIFNRTHIGHRVAWAIFHGKWPLGQIDHINGDRSDNRIANLRDVTHAENGRNQKRPSDNTSGAVGVYWSKLRGKWMAQITEAGRGKHIGYFVDFDAAVAARKAAEAEHGYGPNHGR